MSRAARVAAKAEERRWWILFVLCFSLLVIVLDNSILNVALPAIVRELDATTSQLQWTVDSYTLVFAGLLLTAGSLGDRFGRRPALQLGFAVFGIGSLASALAGDADQLIATRAFMGIGAAFIMPATLSIITNVFPARERGKAIGVWAATAGVAIALGPLTGGFLLEHFYWGSIFLVNLPIVVFGIVAGIFLIPDSRDPDAPPLDIPGALLSISGLSTLVYAVIEAPHAGWTAGTTLLAFAVGGVLLAAFFIWESRTDHPMLDLSFFKNARFTGASLAITLTFFAMFGSLFVLTQYLQFVLGYSALQTGVRLLAFAIPMMIVAPLSSRVVDRIGTKAVVATGMGLTGIGYFLMAQLDASASYGDLVWRFVITACGMALTMAPATESIMGSLPLAKSGVGSAVNDTTRQVGGAIGVAVVGSVFASIYSGQVADAVRGRNVPPAALEAIKDSIGKALEISSRLPGAFGREVADTAKSAFIDAMQAGLYVGVGAALLGVLIVLRWLPARARTEDVDAQAAEFAAARRAGAANGEPALIGEPEPEPAQR